MKQNIKVLLIALAGIQWAAGAWAQTSIEKDRYERQEYTLKEQVWGLTPQLGQISYTDRTGGYTSRGTVGVSFDFNMANILGDMSEDMYAGINIGALYSHAGTAGSNFFGSGTDGGSHLVFMPVDLKIGYNLSDSWRVSLMGGGNVIYRSVANITDLGSGSNSAEASWKIYPNAGINAEFQLSKNLSLSLRPDMIFTPVNNLFVATLGATFIGY